MINIFYNLERRTFNMDINKFMKKCIRHLGLAALSLEDYYPAILETLQEDT